MQLDSLCFAELGTPPWAAPGIVPAVPLPAASEVAIVGAGVTGLSASIALARLGIDVTVIDRRVGGGATARSGGIVLGETLVGPAPAFDGCERALRNWIMDERISCDATWSGCLELTRDASGSRRDTGWIDHGRLMVFGEVPGGALDPVKLLDGLIRTAAGAGVRLVDRTDVEQLVSDAGSVCVVAQGARLVARHVVMAVDAASWPRDFDPWRQRTVTVAVQTVATPGLALAIGLRQPFYTRELPLLWGRELPDGSLLFGRELIAWPLPASPDQRRAQIAAAGDHLVARVHALHPQLQEVRIQRVWAGPTARTTTGVPALIRDPAFRQVVWAGGYGGHGLAQAFALGRAAADWVVRRAEDPIRGA